MIASYLKIRRDDSSRQEAEFYTKQINYKRRAAIRFRRTKDIFDGMRRAVSVSTAIKIAFLH